MNANAYIDPPELQPPNPMAGQQVAVSLTLGYCDAVLDVPADTDVTVVGRSITLLIDGVRQTDPIFCFFPPATTHVFPIGSFDPGDYTLDVLMRHDPFGLPVQIDTIGTIELSVAGVPTPAQPVPGMAGFEIPILIAGMLLLAHRRWRPARDTARN